MLSQDQLLARTAGIVYVVSLILLLAGLAGNFYYYASYALTAVGYPYELDYGEGIVWAQMAALGHRAMYTSVHEYPFIVFHYTPTYHAVAFVTSAAWGDPLAAGRAVSFVSTLMLSVLAGLVVFQATDETAPRMARIVGATTAAFTLFAFPPLFEWSAYMRVDMLAIMLNVAGISLFIASIRRPALFYASAFAFVLAVFTKQSVISGAIACFATSFLVRPALTWRAFWVSIVVGATAVAVLAAVTDGEFLRHIFLYNANRFELGRLMRGLYELFVNSWSTLILVFAASLHIAWKIYAPDRPTTIAAWQKSLSKRPQRTVMVALLLYLAAGSVMALGLGKYGASLNYVIDWLSAWSIVVGLFFAHVTGVLSNPQAGSWRVGPMVGGTVATLLLAWQIYDGRARWTTVPSEEKRQVAEHVLQVIETAPGPVWSEDMVLTMKAGKDVVAEPAIVTELSRQGLWDQEPFLAWLREAKFDFVIIRIWSDRFTPEMKQAVEAAYPIVERIGDSYLIYSTRPPRPLPR